MDGTDDHRTYRDDGLRINLVCCTQVIVNEIRRGVPRKHVALTYAMAIKSQADGADVPDWKEINAAAIERWGVKGLSALKNRAWGIAQGRIDPSK